MLDLIKKSLLTGIGLAALSKDKIETLAKALTEKGELSEKEGRDLMDDLMKKSEQARKEFKTKVEDIVKNVLGKMNLATKDDITSLNKKLDKKINDLEK